MGERLKGRAALVTGSTSGLGRAIATAFAAEGAHVVVSGRRAEHGERVVGEIRDAGGAADYVGADLSAGGAAIEEFAARVLETTHGRLDVLVNNAALLTPALSTAQTEEALIDAALATNVKAPFLLTRALVPAMIAGGGGSVIDLGSVNALTGMAGAALYSATKAAMHGLTTAWAAEFGRSGVRFNTLAPGPTEAEWNLGIRDALGAIAEGSASGRIARAEEVAAAAVFLASDDAANIHGLTLTLDGGLTAVARVAPASAA